MDPRREAKPSPRFLLNSVDLLGREIDPAVLSVANEIAPRALAYAQNLIGDPALAMNYLEEAAAAVSVAIQEKKDAGAPAVRNIERYLFRTFIRIVDDVRRKQTILEKSLEEYAATRASITEESHAEITVLLNEIMATCDRVSRQIVLLHLEGRSWEDIGKHFGISRHAAEARFRKALDRARKMLRIRK
jgi:DNA-directed RNA polymerase specialized sigma24 family protein